MTTTVPAVEDGPPGGEPNRGAIAEGVEGGAVALRDIDINPRSQEKSYDSTAD